MFFSTISFPMQRRSAQIAQLLRAKVAEPTKITPRVNRGSVQPVKPVLQPVSPSASYMPLPRTMTSREKLFVQPGIISEKMPKSFFAVPAITRPTSVNKQALSLAHARPYSEETLYDLRQKKLDDIGHEFKRAVETLKKPEAMASRKGLINLATLLEYAQVWAGTGKSYKTEFTNCIFPIMASDSFSYVQKSAWYEELLTLLTNFIQNEFVGSALSLNLKTNFSRHTIPQFRANISVYFETRLDNDEYLINNFENKFPVLKQAIDLKVPYKGWVTTSYKSFFDIYPEAADREITMSLLFCLLDQSRAKFIKSALNAFYERAGESKCVASLELDKFEMVEKALKSATNNLEFFYQDLRKKLPKYSEKHLSAIRALFDAEFEKFQFKPALTPVYTQEEENKIKDYLSKIGNLEKQFAQKVIDADQLAEFEVEFKDNKSE